MTTLFRLFVPTILVVMLAFAPGALAQVGTMPPPTDDLVMMERQHLQDRAERLDRGLVTAQTATERIRDPEVRADVQQRMRDIRERQTAWHADWQAFQDVPAAQFHDRRADVDQRLTQLETDVVDARLRAAVTPAEFRTVTREYIDAHRQMIDDHHARLAHLPAERRAEAAWDLVQIRSDFDKLQQHHARLQHMPAARFNEVRPSVTETLPQFHSRVHRTDFEWRMHPDVVAYH